MYDVDPIILQAIGDKFSEVGSSFRLRHERRKDGTICTPVDKDPALQVTKTDNGWFFFCHRCKTQGSLLNNNLSPKETRKRIEGIKSKENVKIYECDHKDIYLPKDFIMIKSFSRKDKKDFFIPFEAYKWLWDSQMNDTLIIQNTIGWSNYYKRVIIPIFKYIPNSVFKTYHKKLTGWIGRNVHDDTRPKYFLKREKGDRIYFKCLPKGYESKKIIIVEDCLSAIVVSEALDINTIALLTTTIDEKLTRWCRGKIVYFWLDENAYTNTIKYVNRFKQLGITAHAIKTNKDPKKYNNLAIKSVFREANKLDTKLLTM